MEFLWDEAKRLSNIEKHGIDFLRAVEIFSDPNALCVKSSHPGGEDRYLIIGSCNGRVITVVYTWRGDTIRIISARMARREERQRYGS